MNISGCTDVAEAASFFLDRGVGLVVVTRGGGGALAVSKRDTSGGSGSESRGGRDGGLQKKWEQQCVPVEVSDEETEKCVAPEKIGARGQKSMGRVGEGHERGGGFRSKLLTSCSPPVYVLPSLSQFPVELHGGPGVDSYLLHNQPMKYFHKNNAIAYDPPPPPSVAPRQQVVDTTGAGDAFGAGFLHVWKATGGGNGDVGGAGGGDVQAALRWGCALGTTVVTRVGASSKLSVEDDIRPNLL